MDAWPTTAQRIRRLRVGAWVLAPLITFPVSYILGAVRAPDAPAWLPPLIALIAAPIAGALLSLAIVSAGSDLLVARLGTAEEKARHLAAPPSRFGHGASRAAVAFEAGQLGQALALLDGLPALDRRNPLVAILTQRKALATGDRAAEDAALDALLAWRGGGRLGLHLEHARYHAFVLASALTTRPPDDARVLAARRRLRSERDHEIRAYTSWLAGAAEGTRTGEPDEPLEGELLLGGAALARAAGREPLARALEVRAARASSGARAPYRAG